MSKHMSIHMSIHTSKHMSEHMSKHMSIHRPCHENRQAVIKQLSLGDSLYLEPDPTNLHDRNAVRIRDSVGRDIGYVPKAGQKRAADFSSGRATVHRLHKAIRGPNKGAMMVDVLLSNN